MGPPMTKTAADVIINRSKQREAYPPSRLVGLKPPKPGEVRNPRGRPKGSKHKLSEAFLKAMLAVWEELGADTLRKFAEQDPGGYLRFAAEYALKDYKQCQCEGMCEKDMAALTSAIIAEIRADRDAREAEAAGGTQH